MPYCDTDMGDGIEMLKITYLAFTVTKEANHQCLPRLKSNQDREITSDSRYLAGANAAYFGLDGSPTQVERIFPPPGDRWRYGWLIR